MTSSRSPHDAFNRAVPARSRAVHNTIRTVRIRQIGDRGVVGCSVTEAELLRHLQRTALDCRWELQWGAMPTSSATWFEPNPPDLIIVWQNWPDEFTRLEVQSLFASFPLTRLMVVCGPWCASDGRTREFWPLAVRVAHHELAMRLVQELEVICGSRRPLEPTASRAEILTFCYPATPGFADRTRPIE